MPGISKCLAPVYVSSRAALGIVLYDRTVTSFAKILSLGLAIAAAGCGSDRSDGSDRRLPIGAPTAIGEEPSLSVGTVAGDSAEQFHEVVTPFLLPGGELVVPLAGSNEIRVFGPDGELHRTMGRRGEAPGEFVVLDAAWARGDTIEAFDAELKRITQFPPDGRVNVVQLERVGPAQRGIPGTLSDGWVVAGVGDAGMGRRDEMVVHRFARDGSHEGPIARIEGMTRFRTPVIVGPDPLSPRPLFAVRHDRIYIAETLTTEIRVLDGAGRLEREITWNPGERPSPRAAYRTVVEAAVANASPDRKGMTRERLEAFEVRDRVSAFWDFLVDPEGFVWVRPFEPEKHSVWLTGIRGAGQGGEWIVLSEDGERIGSVTVPGAFEPVEITSDAVVGIRRIPLGVEFVEVRPLDRR